MVDFTARHVAGWQPGSTLDVYPDMLRLSQAIVAKTLFDSEAEADSDQVRELLVEAATAGSMIHKLPFSHLLERLPLPGVRRFEKAHARLHALLQGMIDDHRRNPRTRNDLLTIILR